MAQQLLQHLQLEGSIGPQLLLGEGKLRGFLDQVAGQRALGQRDDHGPGDEIAAAHAVAVDERQRREAQQPYRDRQIFPVRRAAGRSSPGQQHAQRNEHLDLARKVARHDRGGPQRAAGAIDHAQADHALARGRSSPGQLEIDEIEIADQKADEQRDRDRDQAAPTQADDQDQRDVDRERQYQPDEQVDDEGNHPLAVVGKLDRDRNPLRGDDLAPLAPAAFEEFRSALMRRSALVGQRHGRRPRPP